MSDVVEALNSLTKALEAGGYDAAPSTLTQGGALQIEDLSPTMELLCFEQKHLKLQKLIGVTSSKSMLAQFDRQLSYGQFGGSAVTEGKIGQDETGEYVRITVPMAFYAHTRNVSLQSTMVKTLDGKSSDEREAQNAAMKIAADVEFDCFRGLDDFSNAGVFDGHPATVDTLPNMHGISLQVRQSDAQLNARDAMFSEFGSDDSVVLSGGGTTLTQEKIEDLALRSALNFGQSSSLYVDPIVLSAYNKIAFGKERIVLAGSPQDATGGSLKKQWVSGGTVDIEASQFLRGKAKPQRARERGPAAPTFALAVTGTTGVIPTGTYIYYVTTGNEIGESPAAASATQAVTLGDTVTVTVTPAGSTTQRFFNVYRSQAGGTAASARFIGRVKNSGAATTVFTDVGNKQPGSVTGYLLDPATMEFRELSPYSRLKLAQTQLMIPEAHFRFLTLALTQPRKNVICDNLKGTIS